MSRCVECRQCENRKVLVVFLKKEQLAPFFGKAIGNIKDKTCFVVVREDLHPFIERFVIEHELYHLRDEKKWLGVLGREIRANVVPAFYNPIGFLVTILATLTSKERIRLYFDRVRRNY